MSWHVVYTKPREEFRAQENLLNQGFLTYLPTIVIEHLQPTKVHLKESPLFSRYLFVELDKARSSWGAIRSTKGVSQLLRHGRVGEPIEVHDSIIQNLKALTQDMPIKAQFQEGDLVKVNQGPFTSFQGFYKKLLKTPSGEIRAMLLIEFLGKYQQLEVPIQSIQKLNTNKMDYTTG